MNRWMWAAFVLPLLTTLLTAAPAKDDQAEAEAILDKAIKAVGGEEKLTKLRSFTVTYRGKFYMGDQTGIVMSEFSYDLPSRSRRHSVIEDGEVLTIECVISGKQGWVSFNGKTSDLTQEQIVREKDYIEEGFLRDLAIHLPLLKGKAYKVTPLGDSKVGDRRAAGIKVSREGQPDIQLHFDKDTGLMLKRSWLTEESPTPKSPSVKPVMWEVLFDDYKEVGGVKYPTKQTMFRNAKKTNEGTITELKIVEKFDERTFAKPE
jgi:hypothetical protein